VNKKPEGDPSNIKIISVNKKARFNYHLVENFETGIVLTGAEIKSIRAGNISLTESYVRVHKGELYLYGAHIAPYAHASDNANYDPIKPRKLLMHKREIEKLAGKVDIKGFTIVPVKVYLKRGYAKVEIALAKGKDAPDKRQTIKERESKRELARAIKNA